MKLIIKLYTSLITTRSPLSSILAAFVDFIVGAIVLVALMVYFSIKGSAITVSMTVPLVIIVMFVQILFTAGISFLLAMSNLFFRDVRYIYSVLITLWMFASSVVYPMKVSNPKIQAILYLNPMTPILDAYRDVLLKGVMPEWKGGLYTLAISVLLFITGWVMFYKMQYKFAEKV